MPSSRLPLEEFARLPNFYRPVVSWAGDQVAVYGDWTGRMELYLVDIRTGERTQISDGEPPATPFSGFVWTRDDAAIVFGKDHDGDEQNDLWWFDLATRAARQLTDLPRAQEYPGEVSPCGRWCLFASNRAGQMNVWKMDLESAEVEPLTAFANPAGPGHWSPDGAWLSLGANLTTDLRNSDGYLLSADGAVLRRVFRTEVGIGDDLGDWLPDGERMLCSSEAGGFARAGVLTIDSGQVRWLGRGEVEEYLGPLSHAGDQVAVTRAHQAAVRPVIYDLETGAERLLDLPPGVAGVVDWALDDRSLIISQHSPTKRPRLLRYDLETDETTVLIDAEYGSIDPGVFVESQFIEYQSPDGERVEAILYVPDGTPPEARLPAVVHVHGGPAGQWVRGFNPYSQFLCDQGYVVLEPNPRGSTGRGKRWRELNIGDWGGGDLADVCAGAEWLVGNAPVDGSSLAVFGGSYGGYMTYLATVKRPELWRAGVAWVGITDLPAMYAESMQHFQYFLRLYLGDPAENAELWRDRSAITFADRLAAKLLIVHGINDPRCPISQARRYRERLDELGRVEGEDYEYVELAEEGHGSADPDHKVRTFGLLADFLARRL